MKLEKAWNEYYNSCVCGVRYGGNCAHYLLKALIKGGFSDLDEGNGTNKRVVNGCCVCPRGRPIRAKELRAWAKAKWGQPKSSPQEGINFVYQNDGNWFQRLIPNLSQSHVLLQKWYWDDQHKQLKMSGFKGTGNYPNWTKQEYYYLEPMSRPSGGKERPTTCNGI